LLVAVDFGDPTAAVANVTKALMVLFQIRIKISKVIPIVKRGDQQYLGNYRPISLLTSFSKILEKNSLFPHSKFLSNFNVFAQSQFGFCQKYSTTHALLLFIDKVAQAIDNISHTVGIFLDFSKAFYTINHNIL